MKLRTGAVKRCTIIGIAPPQAIAKKTLVGVKRVLS
jgi:hypothetical protein